MATQTQQGPEPWQKPEPAGLGFEDRAGGRRYADRAISTKIPSASRDAIPVHNQAPYSGRNVSHFAWTLYNRFGIFELENRSVLVA